MAIRQLHIMRGHPVFMKEYFPSDHKYNLNVDSQSFFKRVLAIFLYTFSEKKKFYTSRDLINQKNGKKKCLFLSHLINTKHIKNKDDFYFGKLPNFLKKKNFDCLNVLRNFTDITSETIYKKNELFFKENLILSKSVGVFSEIYLIYCTLKTFFILTRLKFIDKKVDIFFKKTKCFKFAGSSYNNLKLLYQVKNIIKLYQPEYFFITYEGHAWERLLINELRKNYPKTIIFGYQFSILTKHSSSIFLNLGKNFNPDYILTTGEYMKKKFILNYKKEIKYINIGSNKSFIKKEIKKQNNKNILVIPEGFISETYKMLEFTINAAHELKNINFIFRFHPMMKKSDFIEHFLVNHKKLPNNIIFSGNSFESDLQISKYVMYRGSAAAIQGLSNSKIPIYLEFKDEINIDPLFMLKNKFYIKNFYDLKKIIMDKLTTQKNSKNILFAKKYFDKSNFNELLNNL